MREADGPPDFPQLGGLPFSPKPPIYIIGWLSAAKQQRRRGIGRIQIEHIVGLVEIPAEFVVATFGSDNPEGEPDRLFNERMELHAAASAANGPEGGPRQVFRRTIR